ncbi:unnamed protein product, partial [marine sediment metagenome]
FARLDYTDDGYTAVGGMGVAGMFEIILPDVAAGGEYHVLALELAEAGAGYLSSSALGSPTSFIKFECYGDVHDELDDHAYLFYLNGFTAAADHMLSLTSQTLRVDIEESARYLVLSQMQDGLGLGVDGTPMVLAATANHAIDVWATTPATGGTVWAAAIDLAVSANGANVGGLTTTLDIDGNHGGFAIGHFVNLSYSDTHDAVGGVAIAGCFEIVLPAKLAGGEYHVLALELAEAGAGYLSSSALGSPTSFIKFETYGDAHDELDDHAYL